MCQTLIRLEFITRYLVNQVKIISKCTFKNAQNRFFDGTFSKSNKVLYLNETKIKTHKVNNSRTRVMERF